MKKMSTNKEEILDLAIINHKQNNFQSAEDLYNKVLDVDPDHVEAMFLLGTMSVQTKNFDRAQKLLKKVIEIQPNHSKAHNNLGTTFQELKKDLEAINYYEKAIKLDPNLVDAYCNLALLYMNSTRYEEALLRCDQALNLSPGMLKAMNIKSEVLNRNVPNWHIAMMNDVERNNFYLSALKSVIKDREIDDTDIEKYIGISRKYNNFELQDSIANKNYEQAFKIVSHFSKNPKENPFILTIGVLYSFFAKILIYHTLVDKSKSSVSSALKVNPFFVQNYQNASVNYSFQECIRIVKILKEMDLKSKGVISGFTDSSCQELVFRIIHG